MVSRHSDKCALSAQLLFNIYCSGHIKSQTQSLDSGSCKQAFCSSHTRRCETRTDVVPVNSRPTRRRPSQWRSHWHLKCAESLPRSCCNKLVMPSRLSLSFALSPALQSTYDIMCSPSTTLSSETRLLRTLLFRSSEQPRLAKPEELGRNIAQHSI